MESPGQAPAPTPAEPSESNGSPRPSSLPPFREYRKPEYNYPALAKEVGLRPGLGIFRRFAALNAKSLLYLQAEIADLEEELAEQEAFDQGKPDRREFQWSANELRNAEPGQDKQWRRLLNIRAKLQEYNTLLLQQAELSKLNPPNSYDLHYLRDWVWRQRYGSRFLKSPEDAWHPDFEADLVALSRRDKEGDVFSRWFSSSLWPFVHRNILHPPEDRTFTSVVRDTGARARRSSVHLWNQTRSALGWRQWRQRWRRQEEAGAADEEGVKRLARAPTGTIVAKKTAQGGVTYEYPDRRLNRATEVVSIVVSSLLPTTSIVVLNYIPPQPAIYRLAFILAFSGFFTLCLTLFTEARRIEIFAAAVALASVQVVFIGTTGIGNG